MNYQTWILERLIQKYERSSVSAGGQGRQKIAIRLQKEKAVADRMELAEEKEQFFEALKQLKERGLVDYSWILYERGNLIDRIWLVTEDNAIKECYKRLGKMPKSDLLGQLQSLIVQWEQTMQSRGELYEFLRKMGESIEEKHRIPRFFSEDLTLDQEILSGLCSLADNGEEILERVFSTRLYGDSKAFERRVKSRILSVLRYVSEEQDGELSDEELLRQRGVVKWPEVMEFAGDLEVLLENGKHIAYEAQEYGAYINSRTLSQISRVNLGNICRVTFIENKANYVWYLEHEKKQDELVLFHGGCYSPVKGNWFRKIYAAMQRKSELVPFFHWSDIDAGGFRIFTRLRDCIIPQLQPYRMDCETLEMYKEKGISLGTDPYRDLLRGMARDPRYREFQEVIQMMLSLDIRLEQENLL